MIELGRRRLEHLIEPISGKAVEVRRGEVLRISQAIGEQCVDFNCFSLHDYTERMSVGHTRAQGFRLREGHVVISNPPHYRPMLALTHLSQTCVTDLIGARCDGTLGERQWGMIDQTNCQDTLAEAIREYDLTPDDVHDSLNFWMHTYWTRAGNTRSGWAVGGPGDHVDILALMDVLAVPITCGSGDLGPISNFSFKPVKLELFELSPASAAVVADYVNGYVGYLNQRPPATAEVRNQRELASERGNPSPLQDFRVRYREVEIEFEPTECRVIEHLVGSMGRTEGDVTRALFLYWYLKNRATAPLLRP